MMLPGAMLTLLLAATAAPVPAERPSAPASGPAGTVTLRLDDYDRLTDRAAQMPKPPEAAPLAAAVGSAELRVRVDGARALVRARIDGEVLRGGLTRVPLVVGGTLMDARAAGRPVALQPQEGAHCALLSGRGPFAIDIELAAAVQNEVGGASLTLPAFTAAAIRAFIDVPGAGGDARISPGVVVRRTTVAGRTILEATLPPNQATRVSWTSRDAVASAAPREARWRSDVKTLVTLEEADLRLTTVVEVNMIQGALSRVDLERPDGFEVVDVSGPTLESTESAPNRLGLILASAAAMRHQFLVVLERPSQEATVRPPLLSVIGSQHETGELAVQGVGTLELSAIEGGTMRRMDVRELSPALRALAAHPLLAAFRYHRRPSEPPALELTARRFPDAPVLAALAEEARVTSLVTIQGRMLTEITLTVRNHAQPYVKLGLPDGAQLLSAEVGGENVKPVLGPDGTRVPLLRVGFRPTGPYEVSFVYVQSATALRRKGQAQLALARIDLPITMMHWELFLPDRYEVRARGGNVLPADEVSSHGPVEGGVAAVTTVSAQSMGAVAETIEVQQLSVQSRAYSSLLTLTPRERIQQTPPSQNVVNLQRRVAGVLPVDVEVPRTGTSHRFVRPLVLDDATTVTFDYKTR